MSLDDLHMTLRALRENGTPHGIAEAIGRAGAVQLQRAFMLDYVRLMAPMVRAVAQVDLTEPPAPYAWDAQGRFVRHLTPAQERARALLDSASEDVSAALLRKYGLSPLIFPPDVRREGLEQLIVQQRGYP